MGRYESENYNRLVGATVSCRINGCAAKVRDPLLHQQIFHRDRSKPCECELCQSLRLGQFQPRRAGVFAGKVTP